MLSACTVRDILLNIILASMSEVMHVGVNTCVNVKMKATAVSNEALIHFSALLDVQ